MSSRRWWTAEEAALLIELYQRVGARPIAAEIERLREQLLELAPREVRVDKSYRSLGSIRSRLSWVQFLAVDHPRAGEAPRAFQDAWARYRHDAPFVLGPDVSEMGAAADRKELIRILRHLRVTLAELVESGVSP